MRDVTTKTEGRGADYGPECGSYVDLALEAISQMAARRRKGGNVMRTALLNRIVDLALSPQTGSMTALREEFSRAYVTPETIVDLYIPEAARVLGKSWVSDDLSFAQVTIGANRLQELVHDLQREISADDMDPQGECAALLIVPPGEQHTLGALVVALQLRRRGVSVKLLLAPQLGDISRIIQNSRFDAALISVGSVERVEMTTKLVKTIKNLTKGRMRLAIGGAALMSCPERLQEIGADLVTNDLDQLVPAFCLHKRVREHEPG